MNKRKRSVPTIVAIGLQNIKMVKKNEKGTPEERQKRSHRGDGSNSGTTKTEVVNQIEYDGFKECREESEYD